MKEDELANPSARAPMDASGAGSSGTSPGNGPGGRGKLPSEPPADDQESGLTPLSLSLIDPPRLIFERSHDPSEESPILYRERGYLVDNLQSDEELEEQLETELAAIRRDPGDRDASQYVQLALFDHEFEGEPTSPPVATLSWKDWQGRSEIWVRGVRRSSAPPAGDPESMDAAAFDAVPYDGEEDEFEPASENLPIGSVQRDDELDAPASGQASLDAPKKRSDSGTSWQAPSRSGEYRIPEAEDNAPAPSSERVLASEELIGALFESMHELLYLGSIVEGAEYVRDTIAKYIPCDGALIHVFDIDTRQFVVVRALGPNSKGIVSLRSSGSGSHLEEALRRQLTVEVAPADAPASALLWRTLGVDTGHGLCSPVHQNGRFLGAIEVGRVAGSAKFSEAHRHALEYICEQFGDFIADRPLLVDPDSIAPPA